MPKRFVRSVRATLLVVVEGDTEFAFCRYLKATFSRGCNLRAEIRPAHGGSPDKIVEYARRLANHFPPGCLAVVFDADRPLSPKGEKTLRKLKAHAFRFHPCIEGFFLEVLGHPKPADSAACKDAFHRAGLDQDDKLSHVRYAELFAVAELPRWRAHRDFDRLARLFGNESFKE